MIVYKYISLKWGVKALDDSQIRFTPPSALNDPFDVAPSTAEYRISRKIREAAINAKALESLGVASPSDLADAMAESHVEDDWVYEYREFIDTNNVFLSLSHKRDNLLMWSHYADSHRGFVIGFDSESPFFKKCDGKMFGLKDVIYSQMRPKIPHKGLDSLNEKDLEVALADILFTKSTDWAYERETRLLAHPEIADITVTKPGTFDICLYKFPKECVREIIVGCRMSETNRKRVLRAAKKYPDSKLLQAELHNLKFKMSVFPYYL